jgi:aminoglycoside phosphotransferase (APT) family kinase protein
MARTTPQAVWERLNVFALQPKWTTEPSVDAIKIVARQALRVESAIEVEFLAQGAFNKLYTISLVGKEPEYVLRVALPVDPHFKTESEAATLMFLAEKTSLPVPKVLAYSSTQENKLGFEWILMQRMPGGVLEERHLSIT